MTGQIEQGTMSDTEQNGHNEPTESSVRQSPNYLKRFRNYVAPAVAFVGLGAGVLFTADNTTNAAAPVQESPTPPVAFDVADTIFLPRLDNVRPTTTDPVGPTETATAIATAKTTVTASVEPSATHTVIPPVTPSETAVITATATASAEPSATATEIAGPLKEVPLNQLIQIGVLTGPSSADARVTRNGNRESGARVVGLNLTSLNNPVRDHGYVIGSAILNEDDPYTMSVTEETHVQTVYVPEAQINSALLDSIAQGDPENDPRLGYEVNLWNGENGPLKLVANEGNSGAGFKNGVINADFSKQSAVVRLNAFASGTAKGADFYIMSWDDVARTATMTTTQYDIAKKEWVLFNNRVDYNTVNKFGDETINGETGEERRKKEMESIAATGRGIEVYRFGAGISEIAYTLNGDSVEIPGEENPIMLEHGPGSYPNHFVKYGRDGSSRSIANLTILSASIKFKTVDGTAFRDEIDENQGPTIAELASHAKLITLSPVRSDSLSLQPGIVDFYRQVGQLADPNDPDRNTYSETEAFYSDQNENLALVLDVSKSESELITKITNSPSRIFQLGSVGSDNGPVYPWIGEDGKIVKKQVLKKMVNAAKENGSTLIIKSGVPLDLSEESTNGAISSSMTTFIAEMQDLGANNIDSPVIISFDGDQRSYPNLTSEQQLVETLTSIKERGFKVGLTEVIADDASWYSTIASALLRSKSDVVGFGFISYLRSGTSMGIFDHLNQVSSNDPHDKYKNYQLSEGAKAFKQTLVNFLTSQ